MAMPCAESERTRSSSAAGLTGGTHRSIRMVGTSRRRSHSSRPGSGAPSPSWA